MNSIVPASIPVSDTITISRAEYEYLLELKTKAENSYEVVRKQKATQRCEVLRKKRVVDPEKIKRQNQIYYRMHRDEIIEKTRQRDIARRQKIKELVEAQRREQEEAAKAAAAPKTLFIALPEN